MSAKSNLIQRLQFVDAALQEQLLIDIGVGPSVHNGVANLLRKGLGIVSFNIIEDFIKERSSEALAFLSASGITFGNLTQSLQDSSTLGALKALNFQASVRKKDSSFDLTTFLQAESFNIYSTSVHPFTLSKFSFVYSHSNVAVEEIAELLKAFGVTNGWGRLKQISDSIGGGIPDLVSSFKNASSRRHGAAHDASFTYIHSWLVNVKSEILAIAAAVDIALMAKCRQVARNPATALDSSDIVGELNFRFLETVSATSYKEKKSIGGKTIKHWSSLSTAVPSIQLRLKQKREFLIVLNSNGRIEDWHH